MKLTRLSDIWDDLPNLKYTRKYVDEKSGLRMYEICNKKFHETASAEYVLSSLESTLSKYGKRVKLAEENNFLDWKAISHAFRIANELSDLYKFGTIKYPLVNYETILDMKLGKLDFKNYVLPKLNSLMDEVNDLSKKSNFPQEVDKKKIDDFAFYTIKMLM